MKNLLKTFALVTVLFSASPETISAQNQSNSPNTNLTPSEILDVYTSNTM